MSKTTKLISLAILLAAVAWVLLGSPFQSDDVVDNDKGSIEGSSAGNSSGLVSNDVVFPVQVSVARKGDLIKRLQTNGIVRAKREVELITRISGEVVSLTAYNGKYVEEGELLAKLDDREYQVAFEKARAALLSAQIEYKSLSSADVAAGVDSTQIQERVEAATAKFQKAEQQHQQGELPEEEFIRSKRDYEADIAYYSSKRGDLIANKSGLTQAQELFDRAKLNLEWTEIRAPFAGYVANCELNERMQVQAGKVLFKVVDVSSLLVDVEVLESEIGKITVGRAAEASVNAFPDRSFLGRIVTVSPIVNPQSKTVRVTVELKDGRPHAQAKNIFLRPGMYATVKLVTDIFTGRLLVLKEALLVRDQRTLVFVAEAGLAKWHYVQTGEENESLLEIKSGITSGDSVITNGHYTLAHDAKINVEDNK